MTEEEIKNMPAGREMRAMIAERIMGWKRARRKSTGEPNPDHDLWVTEITHIATWPDRYAPHIWAPDRDIAAAWEVVEKMRDEFWGIDVTADDHYWGCEFWRFDGSHKRIHGAGEKAPLAICRAALLAYQTQAQL